MSIVEMQKIHVVSLKQHQDKILKCLEKNEVIDIQQISGAKKEQVSQEELGAHEYQLAEIKSAISFLEGIKKKKRGFIESFIPSKEEISEEKLINTCREFNCPDLLEKCKGIENKIANLKNLRTELLNEIQKLSPWRSILLPLNNLNCTKNTCIILGRIRNKQFTAFKNKLEKISTASEFLVVNRTKENAYLIIIYLSSEQKTINNFIAKTDFNPIILPDSENTPNQEISRIRSILKETKDETQEYLNGAKNIALQINKLMYMYDYILEKKRTLEIKQKFASTNYAFIIEGWIKKSEFSKLKKELCKTTNELEIFKVSPFKGEKPPVALSNPTLLSPFELITNIYGTPKYNEWDPSIPLSFFFALFFGICLGDFGYGLILAALSIYFLKRYKLPEGGQKLFKLLILGGGASALVGLLTGSYLGFSPNEIPPLLLPLKQLLNAIQIIDPIKSPLVMLLFSLALGVIQIFFGIILKIALKIRNRDYVAAILDDATWLFFLGSLVFLLIANGTAAPTVKIASNLSIAGAVILILTQGRHKKNIIQKFFSGLLSLYKISGYMGDILSYSRLLALGMSTTIIGSVINILGGMVKGGVPILGVVLMIILLIVGHIFNLIIGTLGAFVHSTRLQMVEFFSKFYEGGGREFRPYRREAEYTILQRGL